MTALQHATNIKSLLLRAWRERWSDVQWGINIKTELPSGNNGDSLGLADVILNQAMVGSSPNPSVMSYLKYALSSQIVSHAAVIKSITSFVDTSKPFCMLGLLKLVQGFAGKVAIQGNNEDSLSLAKSLLILVDWLLLCAQLTAQKIIEGIKLGELQKRDEYSEIFQHVAVILSMLIETPSSEALLHIASVDDPEVMASVEQTETNVRSALGQVVSGLIDPNIKQKLESSLNLIHRIPQEKRPEFTSCSSCTQPLNFTLNILLACEAVLNPTNEVLPFVNQLLVIAKMQSIQSPDLYCELLRSCLMGLVDSAGGPDELKWAAFTFLKMPQVINKLIGSQSSDSRVKQSDLEQGIQKLLSFVSLLDLADIKCNCDCLVFFLGELTNKYALLNEVQKKKLLERRQNECHKLKPTDPTLQPSPSLILRAEPTVTSILKTLDADYSRNQEALLGVLHHMMSGKSFELILAAAAATGKLQSLAVKLIKFNEFAKHVSGEGGKAAQTRALLFDISFLMLCHTTQLYGTEIISSSTDGTNSFFVQWVMKCVPEDGKYKSLEELGPPDPVKVEALLSQLTSGGELKTNLTRWHEVCSNIPFAVHEMLLAWENGVINDEKAKVFLDNVKNRMCCISVVTAAWLCSYTNLLAQPEREKPLEALQQLLTSITPDASNQYYSERSHLMSIILKKMTQEMLPSMKSERPSFLSPTGWALDLLLGTYQSLMKKSCIDLRSIYIFEHILDISSTEWFCANLVKETLSYNRPDELNCAVSLTFGLFHMNLEPLTFALIHTVVPRMLQGSDLKLNAIIDPRGKALARLCIMCLVLTQANRSAQKASSIKRGRKRARCDIEIEEPLLLEESKPSKLRRITDSQELTLTTEGFSLDLLSGKEEQELTPTYDTKDPLNRALVNLFHLFTSIVSNSDLSPRTSFVISFIEEAVRVGPPHSGNILQFMPVTMIRQMVKCLPHSFTTEFIMASCDLSYAVYRRIISNLVCQNAKIRRKQSAT